MNDAKAERVCTYCNIYIGYAAEARRAVRPTSKLLEEKTEARRDPREETSMLSRAVPSPVRSRYMHTHQHPCDIRHMIINMRI